MAVFSVTVPNVSENELGHLITHLSDAGYDHPVITRTDDRPVGQLALPAGLRWLGDRLEDGSDLPDIWELVGERSLPTYRWPSYKESYDPYRVYRAHTAGEGVVNIALGFSRREAKWGRDRRYIVAFLSAGNPVTPLVELLEADDFDQTREYVSVVRGKEGGRKMFGPADALPGAYRNRFRTQLYPERVDYPGTWNKVVIAVTEGDETSMLNHALLQARRRGDI